MTSLKIDNHLPKTRWAWNFGHVKLTHTVWQVFVSCSVPPLGPHWFSTWNSRLKSAQIHQEQEKNSRIQGGSFLPNNTFWSWRCRDDWSQKKHKKRSISTNITGDLFGSMDWIHRFSLSFPNRIQSSPLSGTKLQRLGRNALFASAGFEEYNYAIWLQQ